MLSVIRPALVLLGIFTVLCGIAYPLVVTGVAQAVFPKQANGSLIESNGRIVGSTLIGQPFSDPAYFWGRPSGTGPFPNNAKASSGTNQGPTNPALREAVQARIDALRAADPENAAPVPVDLVTASGSGLDPHISPAAARYQVARVARARGIERKTVQALVDRHTEGRLLGLLGEPHVNVLELNLELGSVDSAVPPSTVVSQRELSQ